MADIKKPVMILFDYGHTLVYEENFDGLAGSRALFEYVTANPLGYTPEDLNDMANMLYMHPRSHEARKHGAELHQFMLDRLMSEYMRLEFSINLAERETIFWDNASPGKPMKHVDKLMDFLHEQRIRTGVISNISFSGAGLKHRINKLIPNNRFEFIIATSEYALRKPDPMIFELALRKAALPEDIDRKTVWYCGDSLDFDIEGASGAGLYPVWYECDLSCYYREKTPGTEPGVECLHIKDWEELINGLSCNIPL